MRDLAGAKIRIAVPATISPNALVGHDPAAPIVRLEGETMGTVWRVDLARPQALDIARLEAAIRARLDGLVAEMSHWQETSLLCRFNRAPEGHWSSLPPDFASVIAAALEVAEASGGAFDPAIGALVDLWGYGPPGAMPAPDAAAIAAARARSGWRKIVFDRGGRRLRQPGGLQLDLSGIAKGYAVDALAELLARKGVAHCLIEVGGELIGRGMRPDGDPWWVDLERPAPGIAPFRIALHDLAVATSGNYVRGDHTLDPATGRPAANGVVSVSVIHGSAMLADAWASALTVLGADKGLAMAEARGLAVRIVGDGGASEAISSALRAMLG